MLAPMSGIVVLDLTSFVAGPYGSMLLADLGADIIKIEAPPRGDPSRYRESESGYSSGFAALNRNKRSLMVDLRTPGGQETLSRLLPKTDVILISIRPGARQKLGIAYDQVAAVNPRVVYCSLTGYGETEAAIDKPAFDTTAQGRSGLLRVIVPDVEDKPVRIKAMLSDQLAGMYACYGILGALLARERTGKGQEIKTSLLQASIAFLTSNFCHSFEAQKSGLTTRLSFRTAGFVFVAADGLVFAIHIPPSPESVWEAFIDAIGMSRLREDNRFRTKADREANYEVLHEVISAHIKQAPRSHWIAQLERSDVPCVPVYELREVFNDPVVASLGLLKEVLDPWKEPSYTVGSGVTLSGTPMVEPDRAPLAGEHNRPILKWLGFGPDQIDEFEHSGVIGAAVKPS